MEVWKFSMFLSIFLYIMSNLDFLMKTNILFILAHTTIISSQESTLCLEFSEILGKSVQGHLKVIDKLRRKISITKFNFDSKHCIKMMFEQ